MRSKQHARLDETFAQAGPSMIATDATALLPDGSRMRPTEMDWYCKGLGN